MCVTIFYDFVYSSAFTLNLLICHLCLTIVTVNWYGHCLENNIPAEWVINKYLTLHLSLILLYIFSLFYVSLHPFYYNIYCPWNVTTIIILIIICVLNTYKERRPSAKALHCVQIWVMYLASVHVFCTLLKLSRTMHLHVCTDLLGFPFSLEIPIRGCLCYVAI